jgi:ABC-type multidrug transport system ATPase subunit
VAAASLGDRRLLLLDEPLAGLDPDAAAHLRAGFARLAAEGRALVIVSNDLHGIERLATRTLVLAGGRLVADLATARLLGERVAELSLNGGALRAAGWLLARFSGAMRTGDGVAVPLVDGLTVEQVLTACRSQRIPVAASRVRYRLLEDLLQEVTHPPR